MNNKYILKVIIIVLIIAFPVITKSQFEIDNLWDAFYTNNIKLQKSYLNDALKFTGKEKIDVLFLNYLESNNSENYEKTLSILNKLLLSKEFITKEYEPYFYIIFNIELGLNGKRNYDDDKTLIEIFNKFLEKEFSYEIKLILYENIKAKHNYYYRFDDALEISKFTKGIEEWQSVGSFENISASGFNKNYGVLNHPESNFEFIDKNGAKVTWFNIKKPVPGEWINLNETYNTYNSINYLQSFCYSTTNEIVQLRIGVSGSVKVWINDKIVLSEDDERNNGIDSYIVKIKLNEGYNRILLQLGSSEIENQNYKLRITDSLGIVKSNLKFFNEFKTYNKDTTFLSEKIPSNYEIQIENKIKSNPYLMINYILLSNLYHFHGKHSEAINLLKKALKIHSKCGIISENLLQSLLANKKKTAFNLLLEEQREANPNYYSILQLRISDIMDNRDYEAATKLLDTFKLFYGENAYYNKTKIKIFSKTFQKDKAYKLISESLKKFPNDIDLIILSYFNLYEKGNLVGAEEMITKHLKTYNNPFAKSLLIKYYESKAENKKIINLLQERESFSPRDIKSYVFLAEVSQEMHEFAKAIEYFKRTIEIAPYISDYHRSLGLCYLQAGEYFEAKKSFDRALELNPNDFKVREILRNLYGQKKIIESLEVPDFDNLYKKSPNSKEYPNDNALILYNSTNKVVYKGGSSEEKSYLLIKALTKNGIDQIKEFVLPYLNGNVIIEKAEVYKKDGSKLKADIDENHIVFTNLEVGDAVSVIYRYNISTYGTLFQFVLDKKAFSTFAPCLKQRYSLLVPITSKFNFKYINGTLEPTRDFIEDMELFTWEKLNQKAISSEPNMPNSNEFAEYLYISNIPNWNDVSKWYLELASSKIKTDFEIKEVISQILPDTVNMKKLEIVKTIYNYIVENIRYSSVPFRQSGIIPQKASDVISSKIGDCKDVSTLFIALCKEVGIKANWVLVNTRKNGSNSLPLPSIDFNHCIASVVIDEEKYFVELTSDLNPFGTICFDLKDANILEIGLDSSQIENLNPLDRKMNNIYRKSFITFSTDGKLIQKVETIKTGGCSSQTRNDFKNLSKMDQWKKMTYIISNDYPLAKLTKLEFGLGLMGTNDSLSYNYEFETTNCSNTFLDMSIIKLPLIDGIKSFESIAISDRKLPIDMYKYSISDDEYEEINMIIPNNKTLVQIPEDLNISNEFIDYKIEFKLIGNNLKIYRNIEFKNDKVSTEKYSDFKTIMEKITISDQRILALKDKK